MTTKLVNSNQGPQKVKVTYYTHPLCPVSFSMQSDWKLFIDNFGDAVTIQFCLSKSEIVPEPMRETGSSFAACLAVKTAAMQSARAADWYLRRLREVIMAGGDIASDNLLIEIARDISKEQRPHFSYQLFGEHYISKMPRQALVADFNKMDHNRIDQIPTLTFSLNGRGVKLVGQSSYQKMVNAMERLLSDQSDMQKLMNSRSEA